MTATVAVIKYNCEKKNNLKNVLKNKSSEDNKNSTQEENQLKTLFQKQLMMIIGTLKYYILTQLGRCHCTQVEWILLGGDVGKFGGKPNY